MESEKFSFISLRLEIAVARARRRGIRKGEGEEEKESPVARGRRVKRGKSFNGDFICDGGAIRPASNPRLCSNGMGFVCYSAVAAFFS